MWVTSCPWLRSNWVRTLPTKPVPPPRRKTRHYRFATQTAIPNPAQAPPLPRPASRGAVPWAETLRSPAPTSPAHHPSPAGLPPSVSGRHAPRPPPTSGGRAVGLAPTSVRSTPNPGSPPPHPPSKTPSPSQSPRTQLPWRTHSGLAPPDRRPPAPAPLPPEALHRHQRPRAARRPPRTDPPGPALTHQHPHSWAPRACAGPRGPRMRRRVPRAPA